MPGSPSLSDPAPCSRSPTLYGANLDARWTLVRDYDFDSVGKHMSHVWHALDDGGYMVAAKGALEGILAHSRLDESARSAAVEANSRLAAQGLRVLALAGKRMDQLGADRDADERDLTLYGLLGFQDPLRPEVAAAVAECQHAGTGGQQQLHTLDVSGP